ncbi:cytochrome P450 [Frigidibacter sp. ROC022]|uniref:cytochrome P450 n=1 Tax=Frigidibacter sp. ROC022 TaxID=2971796 RepID=UPI00215A4AD1|nr:cytochrome P450 [Frigidibacter sp. ROC022]MCR8725561.1 cytochrome P450 [Frigidibacter sp. ROC022]
MQHLSQSPTEPAFVQNPYAFYARARAAGDLVWWDDYDLPCATSARAVNAFLRDRRFGREAPPDHAPEIAPHTAAFYAIEAHSMLELEPPRHTKLRGAVLRAFTSRRIARLTDGIEALTHECLTRAIDTGGPFDLIEALAKPLPVITIARLLGVPESMAEQLLAWSNAMVGMYQARRTGAMEEAANTAAAEFAAFIRDYTAQRRRAPADDLISELLTPGPEALSEDELISTCILLLNAGHEATVHTLGNGVKALLEHRTSTLALSPDRVGATVEEILRYDPPLHFFARWAYEDVEAFGHRFAPGDRVACLLASANRDPALWPDPDRFDPDRGVKANASFGVGIHFCVGAPLARLELRSALPILFARLPELRITEPPVYANLYHFHGLERLMVQG